MPETELSPEIRANRQPRHQVPAVFLNRWSPRAFTDKPVPRELLESVMEAARWAPSSSNEQPWRFIVATTPAERELFVRFLVPLNQVWAAHAPVLILSVAKLTFTRQGTPNRHCAHDTGAASAYMALAASMKGLHAHGMAGFDPELATQLLGIPEGYEAMAVWALGYKGEAAELPEPLQEREVPSDRKPISEFVMLGRWSGEESS